LKLELLSYSRDVRNPSRIVLSVDFKMLRESGNVKPHQTRDVAVLKIGNVAEQADHSLRVDHIPGVVHSEGSESTVSVDIGSVRKFDEVLVATDAIIYGYPASLGLPKEPQFDCCGRLSLLDETFKSAPLLSTGQFIGETAVDRSLKWMSIFL
jgi:hypothetical protein